MTNRKDANNHSEIPPSGGICADATADRVATWLEGIDPDSISTVAECERLFKKLRPIDLQLDNLKSIHSELWWLQGALLNKLKPIGVKARHARGLLGHGQYLKWLKTVKISSTSADRRRWANKNYSRKQARELGIHGMRLEIELHMRRNNNGEGKDEPGSLERKVPEKMAGWRVCHDLPKQAATLTTTIEKIQENMGKAVDLLDQPETTVMKLDEALATFERLGNAIPKLCETTKAARTKAQREIEKRDRALRKKGEGRAA